MSGVWERFVRLFKNRLLAQHRSRLPPPTPPEEPVIPTGLDPIATHREMEEIIRRDRETRQALQLMARMKANAATRHELNHPGP